MLTLNGLGSILAVTSEEWWTEQFFGLAQGQRFVLLIIGLGCATGVILGMVGIITSAVGSFHRRSAELNLKRELLDRGMSAEEIARVVESTQPKDFLERWAAGKSTSDRQ